MVFTTSLLGAAPSQAPAILLVVLQGCTRHVLTEKLDFTFHSSFYTTLNAVLIFGEKLLGQAIENVKINYGGHTKFSRLYVSVRILAPSAVKADIKNLVSTTVRQ